MIYSEQSYEAYRRYCAIKAHFLTKDYDAIKYNFSLKRVKREQYERRKDKPFFEKLATHKDMDGFLVSLFIRNPELWIGDMIIGFTRAETIYKEWKKRRRALEYHFNEDIKKLNLSTCMRVHNRQHPEALVAMLQERISVETMTILCDLTGALDAWEKALEGDVIYDQYALILKKYLAFLTYDRDRFRILLNVEIEKQKDEH